MKIYLVRQFELDSETLVRFVTTNLDKAKTKQKELSSKNQFDYYELNVVEEDKDYDYILETIQ